MLTPRVRPMTHAELVHARTTRRVRESVMVRPVRRGEETHERRAA
jgi:hypothetical protein